MNVASWMEYEVFLNEEDIGIVFRAVWDQFVEEKNEHDGVEYTVLRKTVCDLNDMIKRKSFEYIAQKALEVSKDI